MSEPNYPRRADGPHGPSLRPYSSQLPAHEIPVDDWAAMGKAFDGLCKAGLALTVGFSVAAAFCKMMDAKNVNIPSVVNKLASAVFNPAAEESSPEKPR